MAGTITIPDQPNHKQSIGQSPSYTYRATLTLDASGNLNGEAIAVDPGYVVGVNTLPSASDPPSAYDLELRDEFDTDILVGEGSGRSATANERINMAPAVVRGSITPVIAGGGANAVIDLVIWMQGI